MIKEVDYLVESHNAMNFVNDSDSNASGINKSHLSASTIVFGMNLPSALVSDYAEMLKIAIEIF